MEKKVLGLKVWLVVLFFTLSTLLVLFVLSNVMGDYTSVNHYYLKSSYSGDSDLFKTLVDNPSKAFLWCCDCIIFYAKELGITYEQLNIYLFVVIQPMLILMFLCLFVVQSVRLSRFRNQPSHLEQ